MFKWLKSRFKVKPKSNQGSADTCYDWPVDIRTLSKMTNQGQKKTNFRNHNFSSAEIFQNLSFSTLQKLVFRKLTFLDLGWTFSRKLRNYRPDMIRCILSSYINPEVDRKWSLHDPTWSCDLYYMLLESYTRIYKLRFCALEKLFLFSGSWILLQEHFCL